MRGIADGIADPAIGEKSRHLIDLEASIIDTWSKTVATPAPPGASDVETSSKHGRFMSEFQRYAADHKKTTADLTATCGGLK